MFPFANMLGGAIRAIFSAFTQTLTADTTTWAGFSARSITSAAMSTAGTEVRVTFEAPSAADITVDRAAIGISNGTASQTTATPVELKFSGASGFTISNGATKVSDWLTFPVTTANSLVVILDVAASPASSMRQMVVSNGSYNKSGATYNEANPAAMTGPNNTSLGFNKIEVR